MHLLRYLLAFLAGVGITVVVTPLAGRLAGRLGALDHPGERKIHTSPVPYLGGLAIILGFCLAVAAGAFLSTRDLFPRDLLPILVGGVVLGMVGLADDLWGLPAWPRILVEIAVAAFVWWVGVRISIFGEPGIDALITVFWIVGITNAFNLLDNMDGLAAGVGAIAAFFFFLPAAVNGQFLVASLAAALAGCALGFVWHNFHPAKIFMGDAGALFLGFLLSILGIKIRFPENEIEATLWVPVLIVGLAIFDTCLVVVSRLRDGRPVFEAARDHASHRLASLGLSIRQSVLVLYLAAACMGYVGFAVSLSPPEPAWMLIGLLGALALLSGVLLLRVPVEAVEAAGDAGRNMRLGRDRASRGSHYG